jgi:hypothetical protein
MGCATDDLNGGLQSLIGKNINSAQARLGPAGSPSTLQGDRIYTWNTRRDRSLPFMSPNTSAGAVGGLPVYGSAINATWVTASLYCTIQIATDQNGTILGYRWSGSFGGCEGYSKALTQ